VGVLKQLAKKKKKKWDFAFVIFSGRILWVIRILKVLFG
jgi:hypothetical protein